MTAVEWLDEQIQERVIAQDVVARKMIIEISIEDYMDVKRLAKEMEKQQMFDYIKKNYVNGEHSLKFHKEEFEQYYNETYGSKVSDETKTNNMKIGTSSLMDSHLVDFSNKNAHLIKSNTTTSSQTEISDSTITDQIDGIIFQLPFDDKIKLWELIEKLVEENRTEISDEEIERWAEDAWSDYEYEEGNLYSTTFKGGWKLAIKWYREQLKQR